MITAESLKRNLADLGAAQASAARSTTAIRDAAGDRLATVEARLNEIRGKVLSDEKLELEYMALVKERGRLNVTLGS